MATKLDLAETARTEALKTYHGFVSETEPNFAPIIAPFPHWSPQEADGCWCAAFVYHCCVTAGFDIPIRPKECQVSHLGGCLAWEEWAQGDPRLLYRTPAEGYDPAPGDIVLFDRVFNGSEHDHIGVVLENDPDAILTAEGNINNLSGLLRRKKDEHIRGYITLPDHLVYES